MNNARCFLAVLMMMVASVAIADEAKLPASAKVLDSDVMMYSHPQASISPDGQWIAYVSKGFVCVCNIATPEPRQLVEVPHSWTHFLAQPEQAHAKGVFSNITRGLSREDCRAVMKKITHTVFGLQWTHDSDGVFFGVHSMGENPKEQGSDTWLVSIEGVKTLLSHTDQNTKTIGSGGGFLTRDHNFLVAQGHKKAFIWDVATSRPRATPYLYLTPSSTSGRWIGVEKDTRQLVVTDREFTVVQRFDVTQSTRTFGFKMIWSPDERFVIWRNQIGFDHYSNWDGFWMDLETGDKHELSGQFMNQKFAFTGQGGEYVRWGQAGERNKHISGAHSTSAYLSLFSDREKPTRDIWRILLTHQNTYGFHSIHHNPECTLFIVGLPKSTSERVGCFLHLMNREGKTWPLPGDDSGGYISPYNVVGFAEESKTIIAYDTRRLFAIPVAAVMKGTGENEKEAANER